MNVKNPANRYLLVPSTAIGNGSGHIRRCARLLGAFGERARIILPGPSDASASPKIRCADEILSAFPGEIDPAFVETETSICEKMKRDSPWFGVIILDRRNTGTAELEAFERFGTVCALDEGGKARASVPFLVDILPRLPKLRIFSRKDPHPPNLASPAYLVLPKNRRNFPGKIEKVLVSFGGEDAAGLTERTVMFLLEGGFFAPGQITAVVGGLGKSPRNLENRGISVIGPLPELKERLADWDLVFTLFGLTAFEAGFAGCAVILVHPSPYHRALASVSGFPEIGGGRLSGRKLSRFLADPPMIKSMLSRALPSEEKSLPALFDGLDFSKPRDCPMCGSLSRSAVARTAAKSYFRCLSCGALYLFRLSPDTIRYEKSYFFEDYKKQYGKTYREDFPRLIEIAERRLDAILKLRKGLGESVLDVGCAYGAFLKAAARKGFSPFGIDPAEDAAAYVRDELKIPVAASRFEDFDPEESFGRESFDLVTMWFVIEHFLRLKPVLEKVYRLIAPGGLFAFSTPSGEGVSARFSRKDFFEKSPEDHFTVWEPSRAGRLLEGLGFHVEKIIATGHHPERFPFVKAAGKGTAAAGLLSRAFGLGDTFEVYARKK